jgi:hypothetical protein
LPKKTLNPGEGMTGLRCLNTEADKSLNDLWGVPDTGISNFFYFFGYIDYLDDMGIGRRTAFCRQFDDKTRRFTAIKDDDYEYSY